MRERKKAGLLDPALHTSVIDILNPLPDSSAPGYSRISLYFGPMSLITCHMDRALLFQSTKNNQNKTTLQHEWCQIKNTRCLFSAL